MRLASHSALIPAAVFAALASPALSEALTDQPLVDSAWLAANLGHERLVVIDVRDPAKDGSQDFAKGHVPGSLSAPYASYGWREKVNGVPGMLPPVESIAARIGALGVDGSDHVVIVSEGTDSSEFGKATRVYWTFKVLGHDAVSILDGGFKAWTASGQAVSTEAATATPAEFVAELQPELLATAEEVRTAIDGPVALVDGRPAKQFRGEEKAPVARVAGTIPTAVNLENSVFYSDTGFTAADALAGLTDAAGLGNDDEAIAFCNTGHWASVVWFGLSEVLGRDQVAMYDGSMADWTQDEANPVE
jgi:thiosulfate/3-mercaptopyruvate sulfurtransferase